MGKPRPTGEDLSRYKDSDEWPKKRWAWEFLRRNDEFIADCMKLRKEPPQIEATAIAKKFSLVRFKDFTEGYWMGKQPRFEPATIRHWSRLAESDRPQIKCKMEVGSLAVMINLGAALDRSSAIEAQLRAVKKVALRKLEGLAELRGTMARVVRVTQTDQWLNYLRILDFKSAKKSNKDIAIALYPKEMQKRLKGTSQKQEFDAFSAQSGNLKDKLTEALTSSQASEYFKNNLKAARHMTREGYLNLTVWQDNPGAQKKVKAASPGDSKSANQEG